MKTFKTISFIGAFAFTCVIWIGCYNQTGNQKKTSMGSDTELINTSNTLHTIKFENRSKYKKHILLYEKDSR